MVFSRNCAILENILGADNVLDDPQSSTEEILQAILDEETYDKDPTSRNEEILIAIANNDECEITVGRSETEKILLVREGFFVSTHFNESYIEFRSATEAIDSDSLVVSVNGGSFLACKVHSGESVYLIGNSSVMAGVGALHHKIGRCDASSPGCRNSRCHLLVFGAICL